MMHMGHLFGKYKVYIFTGLGIIVALGVWFGLSRESPSNSLLTTENVATAPAGDKTLIDTLLQLRAVTLSGTIFTDPLFMNLRDFGTQIVPEPIGRPNPFAPLPAKLPQGARLTPRQ